MDLPQEIIDAIIDKVNSQGGRRSLSSVALCCRSFLHRAQSHLFRSINVAPSRCFQQDSDDWVMFHTILVESPTIKYHVREIFAKRLDYRPVYKTLAYLSWTCSEHDDASQRHRLSNSIMKKWYIRKMSHLSYILNLLPSLEAIRLNYGMQNWIEWRDILDTDGRKALTPFAFQQSMRSLILCCTSHVPITVMDSILGLSQLTTLVLDHITLDGDDLLQNWPRKSYLVNLETFGFMQEYRHPDGLALSDMKRLVNLIICTAARMIRKLILAHTLEGMTNIQILENLKVFSTVAERPHYLPTARLALEQIIASQRQTIEVLEFFGMPNQCRKWAIDEVREDWKEFDDLLEDDAFSNLKEFRLLFESFQSSEDVKKYDPQTYSVCYTTEEVVALFKASLSKASARGVNFTYALKHDQYGLLNRY
ncbi:hypothetical protein CPB84DRAFT_1797592 [Gymnopilus junonius]|uniref:Uncharacterized protein n=1 Tax=Gymnopilus junonius TaxID=109634 RepID=A0A9P5NAB4_GYMJU|nr:hypothetical protein CPB84DRAFT_1797592 [Gymnopilus junonius]